MFLEPYRTSTRELFFARILNGLKLLTIFEKKKLYCTCLTGLKICDIVFEKTKGRGGTVNKTSVYAEAAVRRVL